MYAKRSSVILFLFLLLGSAFFVVYLTFAELPGDYSMPASPSITQESSLSPSPETNPESIVLSPRGYVDEGELFQDEDGNLWVEKDFGNGEKKIERWEP